MVICGADAGSDRDLMGKCNRWGWGWVLWIIRLIGR